LRTLALEDDIPARNATEIRSDTNRATLTAALSRPMNSDTRTIDTSLNIMPGANSLTWIHQTGITDKPSKTSDVRVTAVEGLVPITFSKYRPSY
jgi:hypothetical protein